MAGKILGQSELAAATNTVVYTVPTGYSSVCSINILNPPGNGVQNVSIALSSSSTPVNKEYIEKNSTLNEGGVMERTGIVIDAGKNIVVYSSGANVIVNCYGYEEAL